MRWRRKVVDVCYSCVQFDLKKLKLRLKNQKQTNQTLYKTTTNKKEEVTEEVLIYLYSIISNVLDVLRYSDIVKQASKQTNTDTSPKILCLFRLLFDYYSYPDWRICTCARHPWQRSNQLKYFSHRIETNQ